MVNTGNLADCLIGMGKGITDENILNPDTRPMISLSFSKS
jgi:hypothetical protein